MDPRSSRSSRHKFTALAGGPGSPKPFIESLEPRLLLNAYTVTNLADSGAGSLRYAIAAANTHGGADVINFQHGVTGTLTLTSGQLRIVGDELTINGPGKDVIAVSGNNASRVFYVNNGLYGEPVTIRGLTIQQGNVTEYGAEGAGIQCITTPLTVEDCDVSHNTAHATGDHARGGGIASEGSELTLRRCSVSFNNAFSDSQGHGGYGGGIWASSALSTMEIEDSDFGGNSADFGAGLDLNANVTMTRCEVSLNTARGQGGGIRNAGGSLLLSQCSVLLNEAKLGGGVDVDSELTITGDSVVGVNNAESGGGIYQDDGSVTIINSTLARNWATDGNGGGIAVSAGDLTRLAGSTVSENSASVHGGGIQLHAGTMELVNTTISGNTAQQDGGGISLYSYQMTATNVTMTDNTADSDANGSGSGGGIHIPGTAWAILYNTIVAGNRRAGMTNDDLHGSLHGSSSHNYVGGNPKLLALADNGGPTYTHGLQTDSPAIDAGSNAHAGTAGLIADQRGYYRVVDGDGNARAAVDIGAFEHGGVQLLPGDANGDGTVSDADYTIWADHYGQCGVGAAQGDFNGDGCVTDADYTIWADHYGQSLNAPPPMEQDQEPLPGDANEDGVVTDADYTIWADHYGADDATVAMGDFSGDGTVTDADYTIWADNYGAGAAPASAAESVGAVVIATMAAPASLLELPSVPSMPFDGNSVRLPRHVHQPGPSRGPAEVLTTLGDYTLCDDAVWADDEAEEVDLLAILSVPELV